MVELAARLAYSDPSLGLWLTGFERSQSLVSGDHAIPSGKADVLYLTQFACRSG